MSGYNTYHRDTHRQHLPSQFNDNASGYGSADTQTKPKAPFEKFKCRVFLVIVDNLLSAVSHHQKAHEKLTFLFGFFKHLSTLSPLEITKNALNFVKAYPENLKGSFREECNQFTQILNTDEFVEMDCNHKLQLCIACYSVILWIVVF